MDFILEFGIMLAVCIGIALLIARRQFNKWRREDMEDRGVSVYPHELWKEDTLHVASDIQSQIKREIDRQIYDIPMWNVRELDAEHKMRDSILEPIERNSQIHRLGRILHILNLDMIFFHKKYRNAVLKALKQAGAIKAVLVLLGTTIAHFAVVCLFVVITLPVLGVCSVVPKGAFVPLRGVNASVMRFFSLIF